MPHQEPKPNTTNHTCLIQLRGEFLADMGLNSGMPFSRYCLEPIIARAVHQLQTRLIFVLCRDSFGIKPQPPGWTKLNSWIISKLNYIIDHKEGGKIKDGTDRNGLIVSL